MNVTVQTTFVINEIIADFGSETLCSADGKTIALRPQTFAALRYLVLNANRLVTKDEIIEAVWRGTSVTDDSLVQCIHEIRRAFNDDQHNVLQTVTRRGYRFILPERHGPAQASEPSIAVLPFTNMGDSSGHDEFAIGLVEEIITNLSKIHGMLVIAYDTFEVHNNGTMDLRRVAAELGVRYLLAGSVRRSGDHIRVNGQLIDGASAAHIWAGKFDGDINDIFDFQDRFAEYVTGVIEPSIRRAEIERARLKPPHNLSAYDLYLRALPLVLSNSLSETGKALQLLNASLQLDPEYMPAHGYAAWCHEQHYFRNGFDPADKLAALKHATVALGVHCENPQALSIAAFVRANLTRNYDDAIEVLDRALALNCNSPLTLGFSSLVSAHSERHERAVEHAMKALRLSPLNDPLNYHPYCALALTNLFAGRFKEAANYAGMTIQANPGFTVAYVYQVASHVNSGNLQAAEAAARRLLEIDPNFSIEAFARMDLFREPLMEGITMALGKTILSASKSDR